MQQRKTYLVFACLLLSSCASFFAPAFRSLFIGAALVSKSNAEICFLSCKFKDEHLRWPDSVADLHMFTVNNDSLKSMYDSSIKRYRSLSFDHKDDNLIVRYDFVPFEADSIQVDTLRGLLMLHLITKNDSLIMNIEGFTFRGIDLRDKNNPLTVGVEE